MDAAELERFQALSDQYQADLPGPLIGERQSMDVLVQEYAQADPQYIVKTMNLASTHEAYRAVKGDGQCGWRATVFSYFEKLLMLGDIMMVEQEIIRLRSTDESIKMVGMDYELLSDMFEYTWELLETIRLAVERHDLDPSHITEVMNDKVKSDNVVYHFKTITSAYMHLRADQYQPFLENTVDEYRMTRIDPHHQEIDQIGLQVLTDAIITPAGFALEVLYLDRSSGDEVTPHSFSQQMQGCPLISLLYRPGHYDIIYRGASQHQVQPQIYFTHNIPRSQGPYAPQPTIRTDLENHLFPTGLDPNAGYLPNQYFDASQYYQQQQQRQQPPPPPPSAYYSFNQPDPPYWTGQNASPQFFPPSQAICASPSPQPLPQSQYRPTMMQPSTPSPTHSEPRSASVQHANLAYQTARSSLSSASTSTTASEVRIRPNSNMIALTGRHFSAPTDEASSRRDTSSPASFRNPNFTPEAYNPGRDKR